MKINKLISERRTEYLRKMKSTIIIALLLISSIFTGALVAAEDTSLIDTEVEDSELIETSSIEASEIEITDTDSEDVEEIIKDVGTLGEHKKIGFVVVRKGNGWIENGEDGRLINLFWASQKFLKENKNEVSEEISDTNNFIKTRGSIHIAGAGNYALIPIKDSNEEDSDENNNTISFYLIPLKKDLFSEHPSIEDLIDISVGTLVLEVEEEYNKLTVLTGKLNLEKGDAQEEWEVNLATDVKRVKPIVSAATKVSATTKDAKDVTKKTFWQKMQFWKNNKPKNEINKSLKVKN